MRENGIPQIIETSGGTPQNTEPRVSKACPWEPWFCEGLWCRDHCRLPQPFSAIGLQAARLYYFSTNKHLFKKEIAHGTPPSMVSKCLWNSTALHRDARRARSSSPLPGCQTRILRSLCEFSPLNNSLGGTLAKGGPEPMPDAWTLPTGRE